MSMKPMILCVVSSTALLISACGGGGGGDGDGGFGLPATHPINDTGIVLCGDYAFAPGSGTHNNNVNCAARGATQTADGTELIGNGGDPVPAGQDAVYGRDDTDDSSGDGYKGFDFTKLGINGNALVIQNQAWSNGGLESLGSTWSCVQDEVTGLVWEVKTDKTTSDFRDKDWTYTWYNSASGENGGNAGFQDTLGVAGSENCFISTRCDTSQYVTDVNNAMLCGANNWRLPTREELKTLRHLGTSSPAIETDYFPNTDSSDYWTATSRASGSASAWVVGFANGSDAYAAKTTAKNVRLVHD